METGIEWILTSPPKPGDIALVVDGKIVGAIFINESQTLQEAGVVSEKIKKLWNEEIFFLDCKVCGVVHKSKPGATSFGCNKVERDNQ